jgi:tetratricopeptide (TPR) repeat protein
VPAPPPLVYSLASNSLVTMNGALGEGVLPGLLRELYVGRTSGMLTLLQGGERRGVRLRKGHIVHADTNVKDDRMGDMLVRHGRLTAPDLKRALGFAFRDGKRLGQVLVELGLLPADQLEDALALHVHEILSKVFSWKDGTYHFQAEDDAGPVPGEVTLKVSTGELILEAARSVTDPDVVRYYLGDIDRILGLASDPLLRFQRVTLTPGDGYALSRVDGTLSAREVVSMIPLPRDETQRSLFALLSTGMIEYLDLPPKAKPAPARGPGPSPPVQMAAVAEPVTPPAAAPTAAAMAAQVAAQAEARAQDDPRRMEILEAFATLKGKTHFEVLGLGREAAEAQVKEAYFRLARRFHPDVHHDPALADLRDKIEAIFVRLGEAYEVLRNPRLRARYEAQIAPVAPPPGAPAPAPPPPPVDPAAEARAAATAIKRGARLLANEMYWDAIQVLEPALLHAQGKARQEGRVLLARAYMKNVNWLKQGEELLQQVVKEDPGHLEAYGLLAQVYRDQGLKARAAHMLRKVLEIVPDHEEVRAELAALTGPETESAPRGGLMKRLFKRG